MRKFLLYSSALAVLGLSGVAEAACIQTPSCSSLGYSSSSSCSGGVKCPFGNYWNCTGPNNTTEINKLKTEISGIKTDITNIKTNITNLTNRITNIENNSGSGSGSGLCASCNVGDYICGGKCYTPDSVYDSKTNLVSSSCTHIVLEKTNGVCKKSPTKYAGSQATRAMTYDEFVDGAIIARDRETNEITGITSSKLHAMPDILTTLKYYRSVVPNISQVYMCGIYDSYQTEIVCFFEVIGQDIHPNKTLAEGNLTQTLDVYLKEKFAEGYFQTLNITEFN